MSAKYSVSLSVAAASLLAGTALVAPHLASAATSDLKAETAWAISRVASMTQGSYCTMAQKFSNDTVVTIARNAAGEYSVAFDFQAPKFQAGKETTVSLKSGAGPTQTFEVQPQSPQAIVIGLGPDASFGDDLKKSGKLQFDSGSDSYIFNTAKFAEAQEEMTTCMSSMKPQARTGAPDAVVATAPAPAKGEEPALKKASALEMAPSTQAPPNRELAAAPSSAQQAEAANLASENTRLRAALEESRRTYENQMSQRSGPAIPELQEKIRALELDNTRLKADVAKASPQPQNTAELSRLGGELAKSQEQVKTLQAQLTEAQKVQSANAEKAGQAERTAQGLQMSQREVETLKSENQTLKNQLQIASSQAPAAEKAAAANAETQKRLADLQAENQSLKTQLSAVQAKGSADASAALADAQKRLTALQGENETLKASLADVKANAANVKTAAQCAPAPTMAAMSKSEEEGLRGQIRDLRDQLELAKSESEGARKQMENLQKDSENRQLKVAGGNWDLEQATRRYQESQREIRRLGALLEEDRVKCKQEKKDIEYMLFDPAVAAPAQISMLGDLEDQIQKKDERIAELESGKGAAAQPDPAQTARINEMTQQIQQKDDRIAQLEASAKVPLAPVDNPAQTARINEMQGQLQQRDQKISQLEAAAKIPPAPVENPAQTAKLAEMQAQLQQREQRISQLEAAAKIPVENPAQAARLSELQTQLQLREQKIAQLEAAPKVPAENPAQAAKLSELQTKLQQREQRIAQLETAARIPPAPDAAQLAKMDDMQRQLQQRDQRIAELETSAKAKPVELAAPAPKDDMSAQLLAAEATVPAPVPVVPPVALAPKAEPKTPALVVSQEAPPVPVQQVAAVPVIAQPVPVQAQPSVNFQSPQDFTTILQNAGVGVRGAVQSLPKVTTDTYKAYSWQTDSLYGSAEQRVMSDRGSFEPAVQQYIDRAKSRCQGEFAAIPAQMKVIGANLAEGYEIACVSGQSGSSASVLFSYRDGVMTTVAHEGRAEAMDIAMDARDRVASKIVAN